MNEFAKAEWERAHLALASARQLVVSDPESACSRAYYSAFHALSAFFALRSISFTKHSSLRAALHRELVQPGLLSKEIGRDFGFLAGARDTGDYGGVERVSAQSAQMAVEKAESFLAAIAHLAPELVGE